MVICGCRKNILNDALGSSEILCKYSWLIDSYVLGFLNCGLQPPAKGITKLLRKSVNHTERCQRKIVDFFTEDLWGKIPSNWQDVLEDLEPQELGLWLDQNKIPRYRKPWPLSLLALRSSITKLSLPRRKYCVCDEDDNPGNKQICADPVEGSSSVSEELKCSKKLDEIGENIIYNPNPCKHFNSSYNELIDCDSSINQKRGYIYAFQKHVKPKKRHEIFQMAKVVCQLAAKCKVNYVVDVGAGLGHLGRLLSYGHRLPTCCIESQRNLSSSARKLDEELEYTLSKYLRGKQHQNFISPVHINNSLTPEMDSSQFIKLVTEAFRDKKMADETEKVGFGIVGLHPCGDLAVTLLHLFMYCEAIRFICIAGCCYMKLTPGWGFPLSQLIVNLSMEKKDLQLSYEAREMACHAIEAYSRNLLSENHSHLKIHCYRATLEAIIAKNWPHLRHSGLRSIKYSEGLQFSNYAKLALSSIDLSPPEEDLLSPTTTLYLQKWRHVVIFYSLRLMFAPLVESFMLYDRLLYLMEKGLSCRVSPEFDPEVSPRNHLLIAFK